MRSSTGRQRTPCRLLAGIGDTAHAFDKFAPKAAAHHHVYGITRRGIGASGKSDIGYRAEDLADDDGAVLDALELKRPILVGHSFAGEELTAVANKVPRQDCRACLSRCSVRLRLLHSERGELFDESRYFVDMAELRRKLDLLFSTNDVTRNRQNRQVAEDLLANTLPRFEQDLRDRVKELDDESRLIDEGSQAAAYPATSRQPVMGSRDLALFAGMQRYEGVTVPVLAIYAVPLDVSNREQADRAAAPAREAFRERQARAFEKGVPQARVVRLAGAKHSVFDSNEA